MIICLLIAILGFAIYAVSSIVTDRLLERRIKDIEEKMNGFVKRLDIPTIEDSTPTKIASLDYKELAEKYGATSGSDMVNGLTHGQTKCSTCINDKGCINCENGNQYETCAKKELKKIVIHKWEDGDIVRLKEDDGTRWQIAKRNDPNFLDEWFICQICESGLAGGYVSTYMLDTNYEFVNNPINDAQKEIDREFDKIRKWQMKPVEKKKATGKLAELIEEFNDLPCEEKIRRISETRVEMEKEVWFEKAWDWIEDNLLTSNQQDKSRLYFEQFKKHMEGE